MAIDRKNEIKALSDSIQFVWQPTKNKFMDKQVDTASVKQFFKNWYEALENGETGEEAYNSAIAQLPEPDPNIPKSGLTEEQLMEKIEKIFKKPFDEIVDIDIPLSDVIDDETRQILEDKIQEDMDALKKNMRTYIAYGFFCDSMIKDMERKINAYNNETQVDDGGDGEGNFLT